MSQTEFYSPFAHIPDRYEFCRVHSPSHGSFDTFIIIEDRTDTPVTVYVNTRSGEAFMADRYPESRCFQVEADNLAITSDPGGNRVEGRLASSTGPVSEAFITFAAVDGAPLKESPYGGKNYRVWGSRWSCTGTDLEAAAKAEGHIILNGRRENLDCEAVVTRGSYGIIRLYGD